MIDWPSITLRDLAGYLSEELRKKDIDTILVGGACVTIYSNNRYQSLDLDYITYDEMKKVKKALKELGFNEKQKYFQHDDCPWFVEFVSPPIAIGDEPIHQFNTIKTPLGTIKLLYPLDIIKDRLASYYYWNDKQSLEQAIHLTLSQKINVKDIEQWSTKENQSEKFIIFKQRVTKTK